MRLGLWEKRLARGFGFFRSCIGEAAERLGTLGGELEKRGEERSAKRVEGFCTRMGEILKTVDMFLSESDRDHARWIEKRKEAAVCTAPVEIGPTLKEILFGRVKSAVLTSATVSPETAPPMRPASHRGRFRWRENET